jgi:hypothetical protein
MKAPKIISALVVVAVIGALAASASASTQTLAPYYVSSALTSGSFSNPVAIPWSKTGMFWSTRNQRTVNGWHSEVKLAINYPTIDPYYLSVFAAQLVNGDPSQDNERSFVFSMLKGSVPGWPSASGRIVNAYALGHWEIVRVSTY